jgi:hypothetical protein
MIGLLLFGAVMYGVLSALANQPPSAKALPTRTGPFHWHRPHGVNRQYYFEPDGQSADGYPQLKCPFCEITYVKRN